MSRYLNRIISLVLLVNLLAGGIFFYYPKEIKAQENLINKPREFIIKFFGQDKIYKIDFSLGLNSLNNISSYLNDKKIEYIEPNYQLQATAFPNDPDYTLQWYLPAINAKDAWSEELLVREQQNITYQPIIAVLDTGVDLDHPDLKDKIWINSDENYNNQDSDRNGYVDDVNGWDFVENDNNPNPSISGKYNIDAAKHGTIVSSIAAASTHNNQGISGISWFSNIMPLRVLDSNGSGDVYSVVQAIDYAVNNGADIINMSFVGSGFSQSLFNAISRAYSAGVIVVAAAGNTNPDVNGVNLDNEPAYPVCYDGKNGENMVIGVASVGRNLVKSNFSNYGGCVDLSAPGEGFYAAQLYDNRVSGFQNYYDGYWSGTSLSTPLVSGTLALIKALKPNFSAEEIKNFILENTKDISNYNGEFFGQIGSGLLDSAKALDAALGQKVSIKKEVSQGNYLVAGLGYGSFPQIKILKSDGEIFKAFYAYDPYFSGAISVSVGDVNGDGKSEVIASAGAGGGPHIRIFNIEGQLISQFFAFDKSLRNGVNAAVGDIDGDGKDEIIVGAGAGQEPEVKVFSYTGDLITKFLAYKKDFYGGVKVASGDIDGDGNDDIVVGAGAGGGPHVRVFRSDGLLISQFFAYNKNFRGGVNIACGDLHGDGKAEVIASIEKDATPTVRVFSGYGRLMTNFFAYEPNFYNGVNVATGDLDGNGISEILTGPALGGSSKIRIFDLNGNLKQELMSHTQSYKGGVRPGVIEY